MFSELELVQWRDGNGESVTSILMRKFSVGAVCFSRDTHPLWEGPQLYYKRRGFKGSGAVTSAEDIGPELSPTQDMPVLGQKAKGIPKSWGIEALVFQSPELLTEAPT